MNKYISSQLDRLHECDTDETEFAVKFETRNYDTGEVKRETKWLRLTPAQMVLIEFTMSRFE